MATSWQGIAVSVSLQEKWIFKVIDSFGRIYLSTSIHSFSISWLPQSTDLFRLFTVQACAFGVVWCAISQAVGGNALGAPGTRWAAETNPRLSSNNFVLEVAGSIQTGAGGFCTTLVIRTRPDESEISRRATIVSQIPSTSQMERCQDLENAQRWPTWSFLQVAQQ